MSIGDTMSYDCLVGNFDAELWKNYNESKGYRSAED